MNIVLAAVAGLGAIAVASYLAWPRDPVSRVTVNDPAQHWAREGFVEMVPPIQLPSSTADATDVVVWLRIPDDGVIQTRWSEARAGWVLVFPPGTVADRVEQRGSGPDRSVVDVRGTRLGEGDDEGDPPQEWMHTLRRAASGVNAPLFGYEWPRSDPAAHQRATDLLLEELATLAPASKMSAERRDRYLASIRRKNECASCHTHERPDNAVEGAHGLVNRGTDASGFFTPQTVLMDAVVLESYGGVDPNLSDPAVTIVCPDGTAPTHKTGKGKRVRAVCPDRGVPVATLDHARIDAPRLTKLCRARRYLHEHLDEQGQRVFADALTPCERLE
ncbi:hypothetical protein DB30_08069 [Enhygromyxa salina]|uniref:Cytochrome c domain-containing protein n=1 Tax=Enhygromyxa salina TaxID=215803 RepID=A0A0C2CZY2_9BACT|nr:hypothetical protein DB30_08069 [Enhygromyxa salina]